MFTVNEAKSNIRAGIFLVLALLIPSFQKANADFTRLLEKLSLDINTSQVETNNVSIVKSQMPKNIESKERTVALYISADNDLGPFAIRNIKQTARVGSNEHFNIVVQLDIRKSNGEKITRRYYVEKGRILHLNADDPYSQAMDSGSPETLISFCGWVIENFPAQEFGLILWNHGTGALDPIRGRAIRTEEHFSFNPTTQRLELDRNIGYIDRMIQRGMCWDDSTGNYISNPQLDYALDAICTRYLDGNKFMFIGFDACLMQMIEVANIIKKYAHIMVASQESALGYGWNYVSALEPFGHGTISSEELAHHMVASYRTSYEKITNDYTLSALNLDELIPLEQNINTVAHLLIRALKNQKNGMVKKAIKASRNRTVCTHFDEPTYIDLHHFYGNLLLNLEHIKLQNVELEKELKAELRSALQEGRILIESVAFAHTEGNNLSLARGISIYFPERGGVHRSYGTLPFARENEWAPLLAQYIL